MTERTQGRYSVKREAGGVTYLMVGDSYLATINYISNSDEELAANAAFLARACNAHDDLLEACKVAADAFWQLCQHSAFADDAPEFNKGGIGHEAAETIRAAIAQAEGGAA